MVFYFSATGNSRYVAKRIAESSNDKIISVTDCLKNNWFDFSAEPDERIGFITPTYSWGLPVTVIDFIEKMGLKTNNNYVYSVVTFGTLSGGASRMIKEKLSEKGIEINAQYSVRMPDTWTPIFDLSRTDKVAKINERAEKKIYSVIRHIKKKSDGNRDFARMPLYGLFYKDYDGMRRTDSLSVNNSCIGCGLCANQCPVEAIEIKSGKPVWIKEKCAMCLACLHHCPKFAIQRGDKTASHGQYVHK